MTFIILQLFRYSCGLCFQEKDKKKMNATGYSYGFILFTVTVLLIYDYAQRSNTPCNVILLLSLLHTSVHQSLFVCTYFHYTYYKLYYNT